MKSWNRIALLAAALLAGCVAGGPVVTARSSQPKDSADSSAAPPPAPAPLSAPDCAPFLLDPTDLRFGVTVQFSRLPTLPEMADLRQTSGLAHVLIMLPAWPEDFDAVADLGQVPPEADVIVLLPGYPPSRGAAEAWNMVQARLRLVMLVDGPPPSPSVVADMNDLRGLQRVIAQIDPPSRSGFERLQRPLSFRRVVE